MENDMFQTRRVQQSLTQGAFYQHVFACGCSLCVFVGKPGEITWTIAAEEKMDKGSKAIGIVKALIEKGIISKDVTAGQMIDILDVLVKAL